MFEADKFIPNCIDIVPWLQLVEIADKSDVFTRTMKPQLFLEQIQFLYKLKLHSKSFDYITIRQGTYDKFKPLTKQVFKGVEVLLLALRLLQIVNEVEFVFFI